MHRKMVSGKDKSITRIKQIIFPNYFIDFPRLQKTVFYTNGSCLIDCFLLKHISRAKNQLMNKCESMECVKDGITISKPEQGCLALYFALILFGKV